MMLSKYGKTSPNRFARRVYDFGDGGGGCGHVSDSRRRGREKEEKRKKKITKKRKTTKKKRKRKKYKVVNMRAQVYERAEVCLHARGRECACVRKCVPLFVDSTQH